jgi:hypothetical protein
MNEQQNAQVEKMARDAATGKRKYDWRKTPVHVTDGAIATDPLRITGPVSGAWWQHAEPAFVQAQGQRFDDAARRKGKRSVAQDLAYCAQPLSDSIAETPDGYWICRNAVIGRTGFQTYKVGEIADPEGLLDSEDYAPDDELRLWRDPCEVFSPSTIASFEGKSLTLGHPRELLNPDTDMHHAVGHVQNLHRGREPLDSGDWPLLGDLVIKDRGAIDAIKSGERELSSGYTYRLAREGERWDQRDILGNHVALVPKGRAGEEARIKVGALAAGVHDDHDRRSGKQRENTAAR